MKERLRDIDIEDRAKRSRIHLIQVPETEERVRGTEAI